MTHDSIKIILVLVLASGTLFGAGSAQKRWRAHYQKTGVYAQYETRLVWQDDALFSGAKMTYAKAQAACQNLTLSGTGNWRLPRIDELETLYADPGALAYTPKGSYWSSSLVGGANGITYIKGARLPGGSVGHTNPKNKMMVRCVSDAKRTIAAKQRMAAAPAKPAKPNKAASASANAAKQKKRDAAAREAALLVQLEKERTERERLERERAALEQAKRAEAERKRLALLEEMAMIDTLAGLAWQDDRTNVSERLTWDQADAYCSALDLAGYHDWQLPSVEALKELYNHKRNLKHVNDSFYWSSTMVDQDNGTYEYFNFGSGADFWTTKSREYYVRCVRRLPVSASIK